MAGVNKHGIAGNLAPPPNRAPTGAGLSNEAHLVLFNHRFDARDKGIEGMATAQRDGAGRRDVFGKDRCSR
ncbi:MAG: hypothetical protein Q8L49_13885 [Burkholderiaceae bacterium]|nr:hypothetical protein [Burkholderiaceae bacterium]